MATVKKRQQSEPDAQSSNQRTVTQSLPPHRLYYSFADALKIARSKLPNCTADYLLYCGLMGRLKFFLHVPNQFDVDIIDFRQRERYKCLFAPRLLILDNFDCGAIEWNKKIVQNSFPSAYSFNGVYFQEEYPEIDQFGPKPELTWCIFPKGRDDLNGMPQSNSESENKEQPDKFNRDINDKNSSNETGFYPHLRNTPGQNKTPELQNAQATPLVKAIRFPITEKSLFVMHDALTLFIAHEVVPLDCATKMASNGLHEETLYHKTLKAGQAAYHPFQIAERSKYYLSPNTYFTLTEAVEAIKPDHPECTARHLLEFGLANKLTFITPVPLGVGLTVPDSTFALSSFMPRHLIVEGAECEKILCEGKVSLGRFKRGHGYTAYGPFDIFPPDNSHDRSPSNTQQWATLYQDQPHEIEITVDRLFLVQSDLASLVLTEQGPWKIDGDGRPDVHESFLNQPADNAGTTELQSPKKIDEAIADTPATLTEREVCNRVGRKRSTINAYQNEKSKQYKPDFPKKRPVSDSARSIEYLESEVTDWVNNRRHPK